MSFWVQMTVDTFRDPKRTAEKIVRLSKYDRARTAPERKFEPHRS